MIAKFINHLQKAERGQSIIFLAFAFIMLLGFVGLTTDVSLMFVRYATIRRAVDSASLAAATQMRQGTEEAAVAIAARQFVEFHGLDSIKVLVDTCQTLNKLDAGAADPALIEELCTEDQRKLVKVTVQAQSPTVFLRLVGWENFTLQASAISETAALDVILIMDVSESMLLDTTYDDWARIGMGWAFKPPHIVEDVANEKAVDAFDYWRNEVISKPQSEVNERLWYTQLETAPTGADERDVDYEVESIRLDDFSAYDEAYDFPQFASSIVPREDCRVRYWPNSVQIKPTGYPGRDKRVGPPVGDPGSYPNALAIHETDSGLNGGLYGEYGAGWSYGSWNGFVPTYSYYGCCNDPGTHGTDGGEPIYQDNNYVQMSNGSADFDFTDLICQPFKGARDAVELFLEKIDFIRGDRVAFVTFDRSAFLVNPWTEDATDLGRSHMLDSYVNALATLRRVIGVRAEPNFYLWDNFTSTATTFPDAQWSALSTGIKRDGSGFASSAAVDFNSADGSGTSYTGAVIPANPDVFHNYPVAGNCEFYDAALPDPYTTFDGTLGRESLPYPQNKSQTGSDLTGSNRWNDHILFTHPSAGNIQFDDPQTPLPDWQIARVSYDLWASCRGTNIGAALREGNNALLDPDTSRRFGTIWVMVLLSDGAAGASDPVRRNEDKLNSPLPFQLSGSPPVPDPQPGQYGAFGVCPYGVVSAPGELAAVSDEWATAGGAAFPYCSDQDPATRQNCDFRPALNDPSGEAMRDNDYVDNPNDDDGNPITERDEIDEWNQARGNLFDVDIANCSDYYDVDDYARDWADVVALQDDNSATEELLPTIYTIGFGLTFGDEANPTPSNYIGDYLGEQMLRYIADAGDNNRLDNDYYQNFDEDGSIFEPTVTDGYGTRGPCQATDIPSVYDDPNGYDTDASGGSLSSGEIADMYKPRLPRENCGNYFNAPTADELEFVFDSIASKLFTRLTG